VRSHALNRFSDETGPEVSVVGGSQKLCPWNFSRDWGASGSQGSLASPAGAAGAPRG